MIVLNMPCQITKRTRQGKEVIEGTLIGIFQYSEVLNPSGLVGGHTGGMIAYPMAVVRTDNKLMETRLNKVTLVTDDEPRMSEDHIQKMASTKEEIFARQLFQQSSLLTEQNKKHNGGYL